MKNIVFIILIFSMFSCGHDSSIVPHGEPSIIAIQPENIYAGGMVRILGENFGQKDDLGRVCYNDSSFVRAIDCKSWNDAEIEFRLPSEARTGDLYVLIYENESNKVEVEISILPPFEMIEIESGSFDMGFVPGPSDEEPIHTVEISENLMISKFEVSGELFSAVMGYDTSRWQGIGIPVNSIEWIEAVKFCNAISEVYELDPAYEIDELSGEVIWDRSSNGYRLPTEAEWEFACRAGTDTPFSGTGDLEEMGWFALNSGSKPQPSGEKAPNDWEIYDMHGNLWEWCWDWYDVDYYNYTTSQDPIGPDSGERRVLRGGSFLDGITFCRSTNRQLPENSDIYAGIRLVKNIDQ